MKNLLIIGGVLVALLLVVGIAADIYLRTQDTKAELPNAVVCFNQQGQMLFAVMTEDAAVTQGGGIVFTDVDGNDRIVTGLPCAYGPFDPTPPKKEQAKPKSEPEAAPEQSTEPEGAR